MEACARRELTEETGLDLHVQWINDGATDWVIYCAEADASTQIELPDEEHDQFEWVSLVEALQRCRPERVAEGIECVARAIE
jgi:8-oxo-dGTP pyrophosphatase MutT (NUDIX family)